MEQTPLPPLSYYMRNGLWYFTQPPDPLTGQVIPYTTVESWLSRVEEMEADRQRTREVVQALVNALGKQPSAPHDEGGRCWCNADTGTTLHTWECHQARRAMKLAKSRLQIEPTKP